MDVPAGESNATESFWTGSALATKNMTGRHEDAMTVEFIEVVQEDFGHFVFSINYFCSLLGLH